MAGSKSLKLYEFSDDHQSDIVVKSFAEFHSNLEAPERNYFAPKEHMAFASAPVHAGHKTHPGLTANFAMNCHMRRKDPDVSRYKL